MYPVLSLLTTSLIYPILAFLLIGVAALVGKRIDKLCNALLDINNTFNFAY